MRNSKPWDRQTKPITSSPPALPPAPSERISSAADPRPRAPNARISNCPTASAAVPPATPDARYGNPAAGNSEFCSTNDECDEIRYSRSSNAAPSANHNTKRPPAQPCDNPSAISVPNTHPRTGVERKTARPRLLPPAASPAPSRATR